jgi:hypothetical protein
VQDDVGIVASVQVVVVQAVQPRRRPPQVIAEFFAVRCKFGLHGVIVRRAAGGRKRAALAHGMLTRP